MTRNTIIGIGVAAAIVILVIVWLLIGRQAPYTTQISFTPTPTILITPQVATPAATTPTATQTATPGATFTQVIVTSAGFSPAIVEIVQGGTVTWMNNDTVAHQIASAPHPVHTDYPPLNSVGTLQPGQSRSLKFDQVGTYRYHDHLNLASKGTVVVQ